MERHILTISGGGFSGDTPFIDEYLIKIGQKQGPVKIAFIATASNDAQEYIDKFYKAFKAELPSHLTSKDLDSPTIQATVNELDIVYVGGGNTQYMLDIWRRTGFDDVLINAYQNGVILAGISAGAMCWFETCFSEKEEEYEEFQGLGIVKGSLCPHYNDEERRLAFDAWTGNRKSSNIYTLADNENLHFKNEEVLVKITSPAN
ncbi:peptidase E [Sporosarcina sp. Te-1]|uniref:Type 1 glutamine amidotransferase-like domain-containing protein n=1 Tax=Sporosarcina sp. Te-1 TaxID=2818390 RepID=UPI001A9F88CE|nr:peptidase E [Sporosarcina sp. Te-1]QTD43160.1 peptidase E [Sporosarcina sp. Te-1]